MNVSILISTYGEESWRRLAEERAIPSAAREAPCEIRVLHEPEMTIAQVRNANAEQATGDWLCFLDADDELGPGYLRAMERAHQQRGRVDGTPPLLTPAVSYVRKGYRRPARFLPGHDLTRDNYLVIGTLVRRDLFLEVGGFCDYPHGFEDWSVWAKCWKAGAPIIQVKGAVYYAHINPRSVHRQSWKDRKWQVQMHNKIRAELFPDLV